MAELVATGEGTLMKCRVCGGHTRYWAFDIKRLDRYDPGYAGGGYSHTDLIVACADERCKASNIVGEE